MCVCVYVEGLVGGNKAVLSQKVESRTDMICLK